MKNKKYHTVGTIPKYHTVGTIPKSNSKIIEMKYRKLNFLARYRSFNKKWRG